jgi:hypothetical protein
MSITLTKIDRFVSVYHGFNWLLALYLLLAAFVGIRPLPSAPDFHFSTLTAFE